VELQHKRQAAIARADEQLQKQMSRDTGTRPPSAGNAASGNLYRLAQEQRRKREAVLEKAWDDVRGAVGVPGVAIGRAVARRTRVVRIDAVLGLPWAWFFENVGRFHTQSRRMSVPKLNPRSVAIAASLGQTSQERLFRGVKSVQSQRQRQRKQSQQQQQQGAGAIAEGRAGSSPSATGAASGGAAGAGVGGDKQPGKRKKKVVVEEKVQAMAGERLYLESQLRRDRLAAKEQEAKAKTMADCTFQPKIAEHSRRIADTRGNRGLSIYERGKLWADRTQHKLQTERMKLEEHETDGCTFQPKIHRRYVGGGVGVCVGACVCARASPQPNCQ